MTTHRNETPSEILRRMTEPVTRLNRAMVSTREAGERMTGALARMNPLAPMPFGWAVVVSPLLPGEAPSPGEDAERIVRHGLASVTLHGKPLVDPGPAPGARTHVIAVPAGRHFLVSREMWERLVMDHDFLAPRGGPSDPSVAYSMRRAQTQSEATQARAGVWMTDDEL